MEKKNGDKSINPQIQSNTNKDHLLSEIWHDEKNQGLTKREYFSGLFIQGILSSQTELRANGNDNHTFGGSVENIVTEALIITDELLKQLEKQL